MTRRALLVEDDASIATVITAALEDEAFTVDRCARISERDRLLANGSYDVMLTDVMLLDGDGIETLPDVQQRNPELPIIILSAQNTLDTAVRATDRGAFEYFPKPFDLDELVRAAAQAADSHKGAEEGEADQGEGLPLIGRSKPMQDVYRMIARVLQNDLSVLVLGESGTGKELVAEAIHELGSRRTGPFVAVNTAAIPRDLIESELFGHEKGAFTGAVNRRIGKFEVATGGTVCLDEIGDMPHGMQVKLLRVLQEKVVERIGGDASIPVDARVIAATHRDLPAQIEAGRFREDLYYRLSVFPIEIPPLRDRREDVQPLIREMIRRVRADRGVFVQLPEDSLGLLEAYAWPGNVRELANVIERLAVKKPFGRIQPADLPSPVRADAMATAVVSASLTPTGPAESGAAFGSDDFDVKAHLTEVERQLIESALGKSDGVVARAAELLGVGRTTLVEKMRRYGIGQAAT